MKLYSIIIPVYNEEESLINSYNRVKEVMDKLNNPYEIIFIDDGSHDKTPSLLRMISEWDSNAKIIYLSRNFGHQIAVTAGLKACKGDMAVIIDADMQDPPELIPEMIKLWKEGNEVVYGKRNKRMGESLFKKITAKVYYRLIKKLCEQPIPEDVGDFRLLDRKVINVMNEMTEHNRYLRGMSAWSGFRQCPISYTREERKTGVSKYSLKKMTKLAADGALSMSLKPLKIIFNLVFLVGFIGGGLMIAFIAMLIMGNFSSTLLILSAMNILGAIILFSLGILGAYIGRIYDEAKNRPLYIIKEMINFKE